MKKKLHIISLCFFVLCLLNIPRSLGQESIPTVPSRQTVAKEIERERALAREKRGDKRTKFERKRDGALQAIQRDVASGLINETQAEQQLNRLVSEIGADGLAWITRRVPIYDGQTGRWISFGQYADNMVDDAGVDPDTRFAQDPVGTTADLMFGNYESVDEIIEWLGLDDW